MGIVQTKIPVDEYRFTKAFRANLILELPEHAKAQFALMEKGIKDTATLAERLRISPNQVSVNNSEINLAIDIVKDMESLKSVRGIVEEMLEKGKTPREISDSGICSDAYAYTVRAEKQQAAKKTVKTYNLADTLVVKPQLMKYAVSNGAEDLVFTVAEGNIEVAYKEGVMYLKGSDIEFMRKVLTIIERVLV